MRVHRALRGARRSGVTAILVEFVLIIVSLISAVILGGFLFGIFTVYVPPAEVAAQVSSCTATGTTEVCQLALANQGARNVDTDSYCTINVGGSKLSGTIANGGTVPASGSLSGVSCVVQGVTAQPGSRLTGSILLTNGALVFFAGTSS